MIEKIVRFQMKYSRILLFFLLIFIGFSAYIGSGLVINSSLDALIPDTGSYNTNDRILTNAFGENDAMVIFVKLDEESIIQNRILSMDDPSMDIYFENLKNVLGESQFSEEVVGPIIANDKRSAQVVVILSRPDTPTAISDVEEELKYLSSEVGTPPGISSTITGFPVLLNKISTLLITDNLKTVLITLIFIFLILLWYSRDIYFTLIAIATPITSLILLTATMVLLDIHVSITLAAVGVLMLGLGADYTIHFAIHYRSAVREYKNHEKALIETIQDLKIPITASFITTLAGFTALLFGVSPSSQAQGKVLDIGIALIYATTFVLFPILITVTATKLSNKSNASFRKVVDYLTKLAIYQARFPKTVIIIITIITFVMIYGLTQVQFSTSNSNWIPEDDPISESFREIGYIYGDNEEIYLILRSTEGDLRNTQTVRDINKIVALVESIPNVDSVDNPFDGVEYSSSDIYEKITNNKQIRDQFNSDYTLTRLTINSLDLGQDEAGNSVVLGEVREIVDKYSIHNTEVSLYGDVVRFEELGKSLEQDAGVTTMIGLGLVFFVASAIYASFAVGFMALIPIIIAVIWAIGLMGFFSVPFTSLSTGLISLVLGVGVDFSIHLVDSIKKFLKRGLELENAIIESLSTSGAAILLSSVTTFIGFLALTFGELLGTQRLGFSLAFSILAVFMVSIGLVPALISITHGKRIFKKKLKGDKL